MAKKRVYELAKDLGLSNKEMVDWLRAHEYDVKSHSSSLEDDQAVAVLEKFRGEKSPRVDGPKAAGSGVVLRRKKADTAAEHEHAAAPRQQRSRWRREGSCPAGAAASSPPTGKAPAAQGHRSDRPGTRGRAVGASHREPPGAPVRDPRGGPFASADPHREAGA